MKILGSIKNKITKDEHGKDLLHIAINEVVLFHCNIVKNIYQHDSRVFYPFVSSESFGQLLDIAAQNVFLKTPLNSEFSHVKLWFIDQNSKALDIKDKISITLVID